MKKYGYQLTDKMIIMNFTEVYCKSVTEVLNSDSFKNILNSFINHSKKHDKTNIIKIIELLSNPLEDLVDLFRLLHAFDYEEVK